MTKANGNDPRTGIQVNIPGTGSGNATGPAWLFAFLIGAVITFVGLAVTYLFVDGEFRKDIVCAYLLVNDKTCYYWTTEDVAGNSEIKKTVVVPREVPYCTVKNPSTLDVNVRFPPNSSQDPAPYTRADNSKVPALGYKLDSRGRRWINTEEGYIFGELLDCPEDRTIPLIETP